MQRQLSPAKRELLREVSSPKDAPLTMPELRAIARYLVEEHKNAKQQSLPSVKASGQASEVESPPTADAFEDLENDILKHRGRTNATPKKTSLRSMFGDSFFKERSEPNNPTPNVSTTPASSQGVKKESPQTTACGGPETDDSSSSPSAQGGELSCAWSEAAEEKTPSASSVVESVEPPKPGRSLPSSLQSKPFRGGIENHRKDLFDALFGSDEEDSAPPPQPPPKQAAVDTSNRPTCSDFGSLFDI